MGLMKDSSPLSHQTLKNGSEVAPVSVALHLQPQNGFLSLRFGINAVQLVQLATSLTFKILFQDFYSYKSI